MTATTETQTVVRWAGERAGRPLRGYQFAKSSPHHSPAKGKPRQLHGARSTPEHARRSPQLTGRSEPPKESRSNARVPWSWPINSTSFPEHCLAGSCSIALVSAASVARSRSAGPSSRRAPMSELANLACDRPVCGSGRFHDREWWTGQPSLQTHLHIEFVGTRSHGLGREGNARPTPGRLYTACRRRPSRPVVVSGGVGAQYPAPPGLAPEGSGRGAAPSRLRSCVSVRGRPETHMLSSDEDEASRMVSTSGVARLVRPDRTRFSCWAPPTRPCG